MTVADLLSLIARLCAALFAPAHLVARALARMAGRDVRFLRGFAHFLETMKTRGMALAYAGEDDVIITARIDRAAWIAAGPHAALKHMVRRCRGGDLLRWRFAMVAAPDAAPPFVVCTPLRAAAMEAAHADTS